MRWAAKDVPAPVSSRVELCNAVFFNALGSEAMPRPCSAELGQASRQSWSAFYAQLPASRSGLSMQGKNFVNGITGTLRNVKDLAGHAIDDLEKALPGDRKRKCRVHIDVSCCS